MNQQNLNELANYVTKVKLLAADGNKLFTQAQAEFQAEEAKKAEVTKKVAENIEKKEVK